MKSSYDVVKKNLARLVMLIGMSAITEQLTAQLDPFGAAYFQDQYLLNPAMSGLEKKLNVNLGYRKQWNSIPGGPVNQYVTADYGFNNKVGAGLNLYNDKAGVLFTTRAMGTYSYHVTINENRKVHLGLSAGIVNRRIDNSSLNGEPGDPLLATGSKTRFDADFGAAYTDKKLTVQAAFPNMVTFFGKTETDAVDKPIFFAAASYKFSLTGANDVLLEPKLAFRAVKGYDNIIDAGANIFFGKNLNVFGIYHTSKNSTFGAGLHLMNKLVITLVYTTATKDIKTYSGGHLEAGLAASLFQK
jgi:type IX secretion system PorP/SprF family membrane protein